MSNLLKTGLVLSGGGAKGAYHVGVLKALDELDIKVDAIAGASIGALNGAILASADSLHEGYQHLNAVWQQLAKESPLGMGKIPTPAYLSLLVGFGERLNPTILGALLVASKGSKYLMNSELLPDSVKNILDGLGKKLSPDGLLDDQPLHNLIDQYLDWQKLQTGIPLYVSVYETNGGLEDIARAAAAWLDVVDTKPSEFFCLQQLPEADQKNALMASAALPLLYESRKIGGKSYTDGGQGGWSTLQGNTPITPLVQQGCNLVIVTHLSDGSLWNRHDFPETTVIEIRPQRSIARDHNITDVLAFDHKSISSWIEQGYEDTIACLGRIKESMENRQSLNSAVESLRASDERSDESSRVLSSAMDRLKAVAKSIDQIG